MPSINQLHRFMSATTKQTCASNAPTDVKFAAAMPLYALRPLDAPPVSKPLNFAEHVRIIKDTGFGKPADEEMAMMSEELDSLLEMEFDEAAVPTYQMISTFDRKKLKMKKHQR